MTQLYAKESTRLLAGYDCRIYAESSYTTVLERFDKSYVAAVHRTMRPQPKGLDFFNAK